MTTAQPRHKIALLLSGLPRQWKPSLASQLALLDQHDVDVYFHFWDTVEQAEKDAIVALLKPKAYRFEKPRDFSTVDTDARLQRDRVNVPSRLFSQYASWRGVAELFEPHKAHYTLAMRSRADLQFAYRIDPLLAQLKPNDVFMPLWGMEDKLEILSDLFAVGGVEPMLHYHKLYDHLYEYGARFNLNPEHLITFHMRSQKGFNFLLDRSHIFFVRRPHMENYTVEQALAEDPGRNKWLDPKMVQEHKQYHQMIAGAEGASFIDTYRAMQLDMLAQERTTQKTDKPSLQ